MAEPFTQTFKYDVPFISNVDRFQELIYPQSDVVSQQNSPVPSFAKGMDMTVVGLHRVAPDRIFVPPEKIINKTGMSALKFDFFIFTSMVFIINDKKMIYRCVCHVTGNFFGKRVISSDPVGQFTGFFSCTRRESRR
jgi:hypothetical protein